MQARLDVIDTVFDPDSNKKVVYVRQPKDKKPLYQVWLYVDGPDLDYVKSVTYHLHPTFANPVFKVDRTVSNSNCELTIWTWGIFTVHVEVEDKRGGTYTIDHYLTYNRLLDETGITFQQM